MTTLNRIRDLAALVMLILFITLTMVDRAQGQKDRNPNAFFSQGREIDKGRGQKTGAIRESK